MRRLNETLETQVAQRTAELRDKEARLRAVFETSFTFQGLMSVDGTLLDANKPRWRRSARRWTRGRQPFWDTPWFTGTAGMPETVRDAIPRVARGETLHQEIHVNLPVGGWRWFDFQMRPVRDNAGAVVAIVPEAVEVTARRQAEEVIRQAQKMEGIGHITGGVAHDFNNLLTIIVGNLESLRRNLQAPITGYRAAGSLGRKRHARRATRGFLTQRLLAFSRQQPLDPRPLDVNDLVREMSDLLRRTLWASRSRSKPCSPRRLDRANIDANQLEIAILNLAVNARDAMPGGGRLVIETRGAVLDDVDAIARPDLTPGDTSRCRSATTASA